ncbi:hypothetical protein EU803_17770 [Loktanella sp. IMCC34160]|uniref:hypothetical protein n=1 Tax=Loktanella sp. IMCC34160 TaxID=2510646 RepID=UPI00101D755C|nr:hypothetical protein [Loktanella sp. IMCC34160]RYG89322.1 hypothetical protein EU803_17770 [Loktanella sp. IMCC34160]
MRRTVIVAALVWAAAARAEGPLQQFEFQFQFDPTLQGSPNTTLDQFQMEDGTDGVLDWADQTRLDLDHPLVQADIFDFSGLGLTPEQQNQINRRLFVGLEPLGNGCSDCAGTATGPLIGPTLPGGGTPSTGDLLGMASGTLDRRELVSYFGDTGPGEGELEATLRRVAAIEVAIETIVRKAGRDREPNFKFIGNETTLLWSRTSVAVVLESEALDPDDPRQWVGFQVSIQERNPGVMGVGIAETDESMVIVDSYVRRRRPGVVPFGAPDLDEDFGRMFDDIAESNRREQQLARSLMEIMTGL